MAINMVKGKESFLKRRVKRDCGSSEVSGLALL